MDGKKLPPKPTEDSPDKDVGTPEEEYFDAEGATGPDVSTPPVLTPSTNVDPENTPGTSGRLSPRVEVQPRTSGGFPPSMGMQSGIARVFFPSAGGEPGTSRSRPTVEVQPETPGGFPPRVQEQPGTSRLPTRPTSINLPHVNRPFSERPRPTSSQPAEKTELGYDPDDLCGIETFSQSEHDLVAELVGIVSQYVARVLDLGPPEERERVLEELDRSSPVKDFVEEHVPRLEREMRALGIGGRRPPGASPPRAGFFQSSARPLMPGPESLPKSPEDLKPEEEAARRENARVLMARAQDRAHAIAHEDSEFEKVKELKREIRAEIHPRATQRNRARQLEEVPLTSLGGTPSLASRTAALRTSPSQASASQASTSQASTSQASTSQASASQASTSQASASQASPPRTSASQTSPPLVSASRTSASQTSPPRAAASQTSPPRASASQTSPPQTSPPRTKTPRASPSRSSRRRRAVPRRASPQPPRASRRRPVPRRVSPPLPRSSTSEASPPRSPPPPGLDTETTDGPKLRRIKKKPLDLEQPSFIKSYFERISNQFHHFWLNRYIAENNIRAHRELKLFRLHPNKVSPAEIEMGKSAMIEGMALLRAVHAEQREPKIVGGADDDDDDQAPGPSGLQGGSVTPWEFTHTPEETVPPWDFTGTPELDRHTVRVLQRRGVPNGALVGAANGHLVGAATDENSQRDTSPVGVTPRRSRRSAERRAVRSPSPRMVAARDELRRSASADSWERAFYAAQALGAFNPLIFRQRDDAPEAPGPAASREGDEAPKAPGPAVSREGDEAPKAPGPAVSREGDEALGACGPAVPREGAEGLGSGDAWYLSLINEAEMSQAASESSSTRRRTNFSIFLNTTPSEELPNLLSLPLARFLDAEDFRTFARITRRWIEIVNLGFHRIPPASGWITYTPYEELLQDLWRALVHPIGTERVRRVSELFEQHMFFKWMFALRFSQLSAAQELKKEGKKRTTSL